MKRFMKTCYKCKVAVQTSKTIKEGVKLNCMKCPKCKEEFFTSSELIKFDILTGRRQMIRKFGTLGNSTITRLPNHLVKDFKIKPGDYCVFEKKPEGILFKPFSSRKLKT